MHIAQSVWFILGTWIFVLSRLPLTITTFRIVDEGEGSFIIKTLRSTSTSVSASLHCEDNEPKGGGGGEEGETTCQGLVEKRRNGKRRTQKKAPQVY
ncbi:hypothetical protein PRUPE_7G252500 [Prunus persica]|uniref:Uncharacterized protein n=1 Tax=Prunus persica TaxID=3760 RepID=A0A251NGS3_PRUPE|nr:hypothetical protein PRUPE_7G252500 [Prunus persica]